MIIHAKVPVIPLSIIMPTLDEEYVLPKTLSTLQGQNFDSPVEVILSDGGSRDATLETFERSTCSWGSMEWMTRVVVASRCGRATQLNAGARVATGEVLLFLHADTWLPPGSLHAIIEAVGDPRVVGGGFRLRFNEPGALLRVIAGYATARSMLRGVHYGDQAMFVRRQAFEDLGGFPEIPLFEDLALSKALRRRGRVVTLPLPVITSARRLGRGGVVRTAARFAWLKIRYALGADPERLKEEHPDVRSSPWDHSRAR